MADIKRCRVCRSKEITRVYRTHPAYVLGKRVDVDFVCLLECSRCGHLMLTPEGMQRIKGFVAGGMQPDSPTRH
jgi:hypothetical protein